MRACRRIGDGRFDARARRGPGPARLYTDLDILCSRRVWSDDRRHASMSWAPGWLMLGDNDDFEFHLLLPRPRCRSRLSLHRRSGLRFGKSTSPLKQKNPQAEVIGIDLSAPCLRLAVRRANARGLRIHFRQAGATATGLASGSADLVTSTMLLHELPLDVLPGLFDEAARLLAPGGALRFLDFHYTGDEFRDLAMTEHGTRNNEPYLAPMMAADIAAMARSAGLCAVRWRAFDERGPGLLEKLEWPARSEWHFPWAVLEAEKPR